MHDHFPGCPDFVPWDRFNHHHRNRALLNHSQSLERLNERGGLAPTEFRAVISDKPWYELYGSRANGIVFDDYYQAVDFILGYLGLPALPPPTDPAIVEWRRRKRV